MIVVTQNHRKIKKIMYKSEKYFSITMVIYGWLFSISRVKYCKITVSAYISKITVPIHHFLGIHRVSLVWRIQCRHLQHPGINKSSERLAALVGDFKVHKQKLVEHILRKTDNQDGIKWRGFQCLTFITPCHLYP